MVCFSFFDHPQNKKKQFRRLDQKIAKYLNINLKLSNTLLKWIKNAKVHLQVKNVVVINVVVITESQVRSQWITLEERDKKILSNMENQISKGK